MASLYAEFVYWAKFLILGFGGIFLLVGMWRVEGLAGKTIVIIILAFIVARAIIEVCSKYLDDKIKRRKEKETVLEQVEKRIDKSDDNLGKPAVRLQKYLDDSKKGGCK
jgi:hypothetical protein